LYVKKYKIYQINMGYDSIILELSNLTLVKLFINYKLL